MASPLADAHIEALRRLRVVTVDTIETIWHELPGYDRQHIDEWLARALPVIAIAKRTSIALTDAYLARAMNRQPLGVDPLDQIRNGTDPAEVYQRPFVTIWTALGSGATWEDAVARGLHRATSTAALDVQLAFRAAADEIGQADDSIHGFRRVADGGACTFCLTVDGAFVKSAGASPLHNHCGCGLEPVETPPARASLLGRGGAQEGFAVHEHGELGPVLTDPAHDFTTAALALS